MFAFVVVSGEENGKVYPINSDFMTIGRSSKCDIPLLDKSVSRRHVELLMTDGQLYLRDSGSSNGTYINNEQIKEPKVLKVNDFIRLGALVLQLVEDKGSRSEITTEVCEDDESANIQVEQMPTNIVQHQKEVVPSQSSPNEKINLETVSFEELKDPYKRLNVLYRISETIREFSDIKELLDNIMNLLFHLFKFENGFIMLKDDETGKLAPKIVKKRTPETHKINISKNLLEKVRKDKVSILIEDSATDSRFLDEDDKKKPRFKSAMCSPLICKDEFLGIIYIDTVESYLFYGKSELELLNGIANQSAIAIALAKTRMRMREHFQIERDQEIARELQLSYLPKKIPAIPKFDIDAFMMPATHVGGDYYDVIPISDTQYAVVLVDVSGKGLPAVFLINTIRLTINIEIEHGNIDVENILSKLDHRIFVDGNQQMFATVLFGILDTDKKVFSYINAGQSAPMFYKPNGEIIHLQTSHKLLGFSEALKCSSEKIFMPRNGLLFLYTDGLPDLKNAENEYFSEKRIKETLSEKHYASAVEIKKEFVDKIKEFKKNNSQLDDLSAIIIKCTI